jgi:hypothetical protein
MKSSSVQQFFSQSKVWWLLLGVIAVITRFYKLGVTPLGITWDEAAIAYNGWAVWTVYRDEWLHLLPISFQSFGDYKAPLAMYLVGPLMALGGPQPFLIRLPFAAAGIVTIFAIGWLVWELLCLFKKDQTGNQWWALFASFLVMVSPWHHHFSRVGFESGLALCAVTVGMALLIRWLRLSSQPPSSKITTSWWALALTLLLAVGWFGASFYAYHSAKIVVPLLGLVCISLWFRLLRHQLGMLAVALVVGILILVPFGYDSVYGPGAARLQQITVFTQDKPLSEKVMTVIQQYGQHWSPQFLVQGHVDSLRHGDGHWGVLFYTDFALFLCGLIGFVLLSRGRENRDDTFVSLARFGLLWIVVGLVPPALGMDGIPHSNRALLALPGFILVCTAGAKFAVEYIEQSRANKIYTGSHGEKNIVLKAVAGSWVLFHALFFVAYVHNYYSSYTAQSSAAFQAGYRELMTALIPLEKEHSWEKILISSTYGQPYIYTLLFHKYSPYRYHGGVLINYEFAPIKVGDLNRSNTVIVASPSDPDAEWLPQPPDKVITDGVGQERFWIYIRK